MGIELPDDVRIDAEKRSMEEKDNIMQTIQRIKYDNSEQVEQAIQWVADNGIFMIYPTTDLDTLEDLWNGFNCMLLKYRRISDAKSIEIFGVTNQQNYYNLKSDLLSAFERKDIEEPVIESYEYDSDIIMLDKMNTIRKHLYSMLESNDPVIDIVSTIFKLKKNCNSLYENIIFSNILSDVCDKYDSECIGFSPEYYDSDFPMMTPQDIEDAGVFSDDASKNFYSVKGDEEVVKEEDRKKWFDEYKLQWESYMTIPSNKPRLNWIRILENDIETLSINENKNKDKINSKKQALLELGWTASVKFNCENRNKVDSYMRVIRNESMNKVDFVDMRDISITPNISESSIDDYIRQLYIVYGYKNGKFGFVAYSFDSSLESVFIPKKYTFREEPITNYRDYNILVTVVFFGDNTCQNLFNRFEDICDNYNKYNKRFEAINQSISKSNISDVTNIMHIYTYSLLSIFGIKIENPAELQFEYKDVNINPDSKKVFILYFDIANKYDFRNIDKIIQRIKSKYKRSDLIVSESIESKNDDELLIESFIGYQEDKDLKEAANRLLSLPAKYLKIAD